MLLCVDIGNTNIMLGLYEDDVLGPHWRLSTDHERMPDEFAMQLLNLLHYAGVAPERISGVAIASGVPICHRALARGMHRLFALRAADHRRAHEHRPHHPV